MALMVALGFILHRLEALLPLPTPWVKVRLANLMTLMALFYLGTREDFYRNPSQGHTSLYSDRDFFRPHFFSQPGR